VWQDYSLEQEIPYNWSTKPKDWRTWNLSRSRAYHSVKTYTEGQDVQEPDTAYNDPR
jgi:hypothetical protein